MSKPEMIENELEQLLGDFAGKLVEQGVPRKLLAENLILLGQEILRKEQGAEVAASFLETVVKLLRKPDEPGESNRGLLN